MQKYARYVPAVAAIVFLSVVMVLGFLLPSEKPEPYVPEEYTYEITATDVVIDGWGGKSRVTVTLDRVPSTPLTYTVRVGAPGDGALIEDSSEVSVSFIRNLGAGFEWEEGRVWSSPDWFIESAKDSSGYPVRMIRAQTVSV